MAEEQALYKLTTLIERYSSNLRSKGSSARPSKRTLPPQTPLPSFPTQSDVIWTDRFAHMTLSDRQALRYIIRNTTLPQRARASAQLQLSQMHCYTRSTQINNRCIEGGKSRGVLKDFRMARVSIFNDKHWTKSACQEKRLTIGLLVPISNECAGGKYTWCEEGELVMQNM